MCACACVCVRVCVSVYYFGGLLLVSEQLVKLGGSLLHTEGRLGHRSQLVLQGGRVELGIVHSATHTCAHTQTDGQTHIKDSLMAKVGRPPAKRFWVECPQPLTTFRLHSLYFASDKSF